ncbi:unnamed protein product, partial [Polarella glacialis]
SRVLKTLRFVPLLKSSPEKAARVALAISEKLTVLLATRVAFLSICIAVIVPLFNMFLYPEVDDSMSTWVLLLSKNAEQYYAAPALLKPSMGQRINSELRRFVSFYTNNALYGPFDVCFRSSPSASFVCPAGNILGVTWDSSFTEPRRKASILVVSTDDAKAFFDLSTIRQYEALSNIVFLMLILFLMGLTCMLMSSSVSMVVLKPLDRIFLVIRKHCADIFSVSRQLHEMYVQENADVADITDLADVADHEQETASEYALLDKVLARISKICQNLAPEATRTRGDTEEERMLMHFQGGQSFPLGSSYGLKISQEQRKRSSIRRPVVRELITTLLPISLRLGIDEQDFNAFQVEAEERLRLAAYALLNSRGSFHWA